MGSQATKPQRVQDSKTRGGPDGSWPLGMLSSRLDALRFIGHGNGGATDGGPTKMRNAEIAMFSWFKRC